MVMKPDYEGVRAYALAYLENEIDPALTYHNLSHTRDDVLPAAENLAQHSGVRDGDLLLLRTAALFHDIGFTRQRVGHEEAGIAIASGVLPGFGYSTGQMDSIAAMIRATKLPQQPHSLLEELLADADLAVLGGTNFVERNHQLRDEVATFEGPVSDVVWYTSQIAFVGSHQYFTAAAHQLLDMRKQDNLAFLKQQLAQVTR